MLGHHWEKAEATVVARIVRTQAVGRMPHYDFVVDVRPYGGTPLRMTIQDGPADFADPSVGDVLGVLYDRKNQHVKWDTSDPWLRDGQAGGSAFGSTATGSPGAPWAEMAGFGDNVQTLSGDAATEMLESLFGQGGAEKIAAMKARAQEQRAHAVDPAERLARLQTLRDSGVLTEAEYEAQRQKIISAI
jgi:Short C-terminal domain